jgi:lantibiotic biosynthesis protein
MKAYKMHCFSKYILRTPAFPVGFYFDVLQNYSPKKLLEVCSNDYFRESIRIASPELLATIDKWKNNPKNINTEKNTKLEHTLLKYVARIATRCTPFGLFAGCAVGDFANETNIVVRATHEYSRHTQFDMHFWVNLLDEFSSRKEVQEQLLYFPNNSLYSIGDFYRFVTYKYVNSKREHSICALRKSELLAVLIQESANGIKMDAMITFLADDDSEKEDALDFILELIDMQFLVSELDATVTGDDEWKRLFTIVEKIPSLKHELKILQNIKTEFGFLDASVVPNETIYTNIKAELQKMNVAFEERHLFQTDLNINATENNLDQIISTKVLQALHFLNGIQTKKSSENQMNFIKKFQQRYETREMPLAQVLDTETGIGYLQHTDNNDSHDLLDAFSFTEKKEIMISQKWIPIDLILEKKLQECLQENNNCMQLTEKDFPDFDANWNDAPATFCAMVEISGRDEKQTIALTSSGDVSAAKLLGRFCNGNEEIHRLTKNIIAKENIFYSDKILAEIAHIPESRTGNILRRPVLRDFEIAYLSNSGVDISKNIPIDDLYVSVQNNKIILRSKKHNKIVFPCLSNAHSFYRNSLPIYHFLCDLQSQGLKTVPSFSWGILESHYNYFPRVQYKDVILSKAKWIITQKELESFSKLYDDLLFTAFLKWRTKRNITRFVNWVQFDNTLLLDFDKLICIQLFLKSVQNLSKIVLEEFLFAEESVVSNSNNAAFTNQFILSFYKE